MKLRIITIAKNNVDNCFFLSIMSVLDGLKNMNINVSFDLVPGQSNIDQARSGAVTRFFHESVSGDQMLFIDSDHSFTIDDVLKALLINSDVCTGCYCGATSMPCYTPSSYENNFKRFNDGIDNEMLYGATGFMRISYDILKKIAEDMTFLGAPYAKVGYNRHKIIPFFINEIYNDDTCDSGSIWCGEDFSFCRKVRSVGGTIKGFLTNTLGHNCSKLLFNVPSYDGKEPVPYLKNLMEKPEMYLSVPKIIVKNVFNWIKYESNNKRKYNIIYYLNDSIKFGLFSEKMTGSEQAVINLYNHWIRMGHTVTVCGKNLILSTNWVNSVSDFNVFDIVICHRHFEIPVCTAKIILDLHDNITDVPIELDKKVSLALMKSNWHRYQFLNINNDLKLEKIVFIPNGIKKEMITGIRNPIKLFYGHCYRRGLISFISNCWGKLRSKIPNLELHCAYGYEYVTGQEKKILDEIFALKDSGIFNHGRISLDDIYKLKSICNLDVYPCVPEKWETDCISIRESAYLGCIPVCFNDGVFNERICIKVNSNDYNQYYEKIVEMCTVNIESLRKEIMDLSESTDISWDDVSKNWISLFDITFNTKKNYVRKNKNGKT